MADTVLHQALLTFIQQDLAGYVKGGWLLRRAWKHYNKLHKDILQIHQQVKARGASQSLPEAEQSLSSDQGSMSSSKGSQSSLNSHNKLTRSTSSSDSVDIKMAGTAEMTEDVSARWENKLVWNVIDSNTHMQSHNIRLQAFHL